VKGAPNRRWHTKQHARLTEKVQTYIIAKLPTWQQEFQAQTTARQNRLEARIQRVEERTRLKSTPQYKLQKLQEQRKRWATKLKRAQTAIKKLDRRIKIWERKQ
jgi:molecular chaperone GrpE (heat shock protein)